MDLLLKTMMLTVKNVHLENTVLQKEVLVVVNRVPVANSICQVVQVTRVVLKIVIQELDLD